ncbi:MULTISPECIES: MFS transporter [unclassified Streptomyces]|uniref:MFS transporter n=1 Tax=unclassified Streptomyces TaxID=2593676 RepID=UPI000995F5C0|nr:MULTISPECIES: MFS transporter [unclassified Streptomyces]
MSSVAAVSVGRQRAVLAAMCAASVLVVGFVASINLAVPMLAASDLHPTAAQLLWIIDAYVVFFACLVIPAGAAGDRFGRKGVLMAGFGVFAVGAVLSSAAPSVAVMLAGRATTGVGAALVLPNTLAVLLHTIPPARRRAAVTTWATMGGIGGALGNVGGGLALSSGSWRLLFDVVAPAAVVLLVLVAVIVPRSARSDAPLDPVGAVLLTAATVTLMLGIIQGPEQGWGSVLVVGAFVGSAVLWAVWVIVGLRTRHPLLDPRLCKLPALVASCVGMLLAFFGNFGLFYVNASLLQYVHGFSVLATGLGILPMIVPLLILPRFVPRFVARFGIPAVLAFAFAVLSIGMFALSLHTTGSYLAYALCLVVIGVGMAPAMPALTVEMTESLPAAQAGVGGGLQSATRELGSALGVAVIGTIITQAFRTPGGTAQTVSEALATDPGSRTAIIDSYASAASLGLAVTSLLVLAAGIVTVSLTLWAARHHRRNAPAPTTAAPAPQAPAGTTASAATAPDSTTHQKEKHS